MEAYKRQLVRVLVRRGQARAELGQVAEALEDYELALRWGGVCVGWHPVGWSACTPGLAMCNACWARTQTHAHAHACTRPPCRHNPEDASLSADVAELRASLAPADAAALRQRGAARFASGDHAGAVEAWSVLLQLPHTAVSGAGDGAGLHEVPGMQ